MLDLLGLSLVGGCSAPNRFHHHPGLKKNHFGLRDLNGQPLKILVRQTTNELIDLEHPPKPP